MDAVFTSSKPFDTKSHDGAFYHPSHAKQLSYDEKKLCLSPEVKLHLTGGSNILQRDSFQALSIALQQDSIPTKDTEMHASSTSSDFEETWPSTDLARSTKMDSLNSTSPLSHMSKRDEMLGDVITESDGPKSTIARYIQRFRSEPPKPREERTDIVGKTNDVFWWATEPSRSSTPKESECSTLSPPVRLRDTWRESHKSTKKPPKNVNKQPTTFGPKVIENKRNVISEKQCDELISDIDGMQLRAQNLIELSENTLISSSSDAPLQNQVELKKDPLLTASTLQPKSVTRNSQIAQKPTLHYRDDILYQWRLAQRMEKARQESCVFSKIPYMQEKRIDADLESKDQTSKDGNIKGTQVKEEIRRRQMRLIDAQIEDSNEIQTTQKDISNPDMCYKSVEVQTMPSCIHALIDRANIDGTNEVPYVHTVCDILPCPHRSRIENNLPNEQMYHLHDKLSRTSYSQMAAPIVSSNSPVGSPEIKEGKTAACDQGDPSTVISDVEDSNYHDDSRRKRLVEPRVENFQTTCKDSNSVKQQKDAEHLYEENIKLENGNIRREKEFNYGSKRILKDTSRKGGTASNKIAETIDEIVSENLFTASPSHNSWIHSKSSNDMKEDNTEVSKESQDLCTVIGYESSDGEFPGDDVLKVLRMRRKRYLHILSDIRTVLDEAPSDKN